MASGSQNRTSGERHLGPWAIIALVGVAVAFVTASSDLTEIRRAEADIHWAEPVLWEITSAIAIIALAPLIGLAMRRWPPREDNLLRPGLIHFALTIPFAAAHVTAIFVARESAYWAVGAHYGFFEEDGVLGTFVYEWRKDVLTYAAIAALYWWFQLRAEKRPTPTAADPRIEIRDGGAAVFLGPDDILFVEAAGNYIEFHTAGRTHLVRGTLAAWEARLAARG
ncbi:MAG: LytTR family transcriptional regulator, partial [Phycisphaerales bacterium]|nr:LytTR family transcriptional regulator [Hyphomonadaceae bacterium]